MSQTVKIILGIVIVVVVAAGSFYGGTVYGKGQAQAAVAAARRTTGTAGGLQGQGQSGAGGFQGQGQQGAGGRQGGQGGGFVFGQIEAIGTNSLTITDNTGKQTQVTVSDTTLIEKNASVTVSDLKKGDTVIVSGGQGTDGSITARSVQVSPAGRFMGGNQGSGGNQ